jgi:hypothetical protein
MKVVIYTGTLTNYATSKKQQEKKKNSASLVKQLVNPFVGTD